MARHVLLVLWALLVLCGVVAAGYFSGWKWNVLAGCALIGFVLFFKGSRFFYPIPPRRKEKSS